MQPRSRPSRLSVMKLAPSRLSQGASSLAGWLNPSCPAIAARARGSSTAPASSGSTGPSERSTTCPDPVRNTNGVTMGPASTGISGFLEEGERAVADDAVLVAGGIAGIAQVDQLGL